MPFATSTTLIQRYANAMYGVELGSITLSQVQADIGTGGIAGLNATLNAYYGGDFGGSTNASVASTILGNIGIVAGLNGLNAAQVKVANDYIVANLNATPAAGRGAMVLSILNSFAGMTADPVFGAASTAYGAAVAGAVTWGTSNTSNAPSSTSTIVNLTSAVGVSTAVTTNQLFVANLSDNQNTFQSGDSIVGNGTAANKNMLYATLGNSSKFAILASTTGVQQAVFSSQSTNATGSSGNNNVDTTGQKNTVDAAQMIGVTQWWNTDSRADLKVEDVRIMDSQITKDITIVMRNTDPGSMNAVATGGTVLNVGAGDAKVDYELYFSPESLRAASSVNTAAVTVFVSSQLQQGTALPGASYDPSKPLANLPYDTLNVMANGQLITLKLDLAGAALTNGHTIATLTQADFQLALVNAVKLASGGLATVTVNTNAYNYSSTDAVARSVNTYTITASGFTLGVPATGVWNASLGLPATNAFAASAVVGTPSATAPLITSSIILDNVGREGEAGSLTIGSMDTRGGVERFEIKVASNDGDAKAGSQSGSWIDRAQSTNNTLREVSVMNVVSTDNYHETGVIAGRQVDADASANTRTLAQITQANSDYLYIGTGIDQAGNNLNQARDINASTVAAGSPLSFKGFVNADGLRDVKIFDASTFKGDMKIGAYFDAANVAKYQNLTDTAAADKADDAQFVYTLGSGNNSLNVNIDPTNYGATVASNANRISGERHDFTFTFNGGSGSNNIQVAIQNADHSGMTSSQYAAATYNQGLNYNYSTVKTPNYDVIINGGSGSSVIRKPGAGSAMINGQTSNTTIYTDNTGSDGLVSTAANNSFTDNLNNFSDDGIVNNDGFAQFVFNVLPDSFTGLFPLDALHSAAPASVSAVNATLTVNFLGFVKTVNIGTSAGSMANTTITDLTVNQAIKDAINNDVTLNKLLLAEDGPGHALIVHSLIDGNMANYNPLLVNSANNTALQITLGSTALSAGQTGLNVLSAANFAALGANSSGAFVTNFAASSNMIAVGQVDPITGKTVVTAGTTLTATTEYTTAYLHTGANSTNVSDNVVNPGSGTAVVVLGTAGYLGAGNPSTLLTSKAVNPASQLNGSNDIVVYQNFGNGHDSIVNFDTSLTTFATAATTSFAVTLTTNIRETDVVTFSASNGTSSPESIIFDGVTVNLSAGATQGVIPAQDVALQFAQAYGVAGGTTWNVIANAAGVGNTSVTLQKKTFGNVTDLAASNFNGTLAAPSTYVSQGGGVASPVTTIQGSAAGTAGVATNFDVSFSVANSAAAANGSFATTFDGVNSIAYLKGDGALTLATKVAAGNFADFNTSVDTTVAGTVTVHFTEKVTSTNDNLAVHGPATATEFGFGTNNIAGSVAIVGAAGASSVGATVVTTSVAAVAAGAPGQGFDMLDFSAYRVGAVYVGNTLVAGALTSALNSYVQLVENTVATSTKMAAGGEYTMTVYNSGSDNAFGGTGTAADTVVGVVGVTDFGVHQNFVAKSFII